MNPFSVLTSKIFAGTTILLGMALCLTIWIYSGMVASRDATIETQRQQLAECNAARAVQNAAIQREGEAQHAAEQRFDQAAEQGQRAMAAIQPQVRIVRQTPNNGCRTPPQIMGAGL